MPGGRESRHVIADLRQNRLRRPPRDPRNALQKGEGRPERAGRLREDPRPRSSRSGGPARRSCPDAGEAGSGGGREPARERLPPAPDALPRRLPFARPASAFGSSSPAIIAFQDRPPGRSHDVRTPPLTFASSKTLPTRLTCELRSRTSVLRSRVRSRRSRISAGGTKLPLSSPHSRSRASLSQSLTSVLRPGTCLTCRALKRALKGTIKQSDL